MTPPHDSCPWGSEMPVPWPRPIFETTSDSLSCLCMKSTVLTLPVGEKFAQGVHPSTRDLLGERFRVSPLGPGQPGWTAHNVVAQPGGRASGAATGGTLKRRGWLVWDTSCVRRVCVCARVHARLQLLKEGLLFFIPKPAFLPTSPKCIANVEKAWSTPPSAYSLRTL